MANLNTNTNLAGSSDGPVQRHSANVGSLVASWDERYNVRRIERYQSEDDSLVLSDADVPTANTAFLFREFLEGGTRGSDILRPPQFNAEGLREFMLQARLEDVTTSCSGCADVIPHGCGGPPAAGGNVAGIASPRTRQPPDPRGRRCGPLLAFVDDRRDPIGDHVNYRQWHSEAYAVQNPIGKNVRICALCERGLFKRLREKVRSAHNCGVRGFEC